MKVSFAKTICASTLGVLTLSPCASAAVVVEDFNYATDNQVLLGATGGSGWSGAWGPSTGVGQNTSRIRVDIDANLTYSTGGYNISQTGTGRVYGDFNAFRGINRYIDTNLTGAVWFSALVQNTGSSHHAGVQFNNHADAPFDQTDYNQGLFDVEIANTDLVVRYNGTNNTIVGPSFALSQTHLILGRITFQDNGANDKLEVWADPADLTNLGSALFTANSADIGADLFLAGYFGYGSSNVTNTMQGLADALRFSDGGGNPDTAYLDVTGVSVPEPGGMMVVPVAIGLLVRRRRPGNSAR